MVLAVRLWASLWRVASLRARGCLDAALLSEWTGQGQGRVDVAALCSLSVALLTLVVEEEQRQPPAPPSSFPPSLSSAVLLRLFAPLSSLSTRGRGVVARRLLPLLLTVTGRPSTPLGQRCDAALLISLLGLWQSALHSHSAEQPSLLPQHSTPPLCAPLPSVLTFPRAPLLSTLMASHPLVGDLFLLLCLLWEPLLSVLDADGVQLLLDLVLSCAVVGLSSGGSVVAAQCAFLIRQRAELIHAQQQRRDGGVCGDGAEADTDEDSWSSSTHTVATLRSAMRVERRADWLDFLAVHDGLRSSQPHLLLAVWPRLYHSRLPCAFVLLLVDRALCSSMKTLIAQHLIAHLRHTLIPPSPPPPHTAPPPVTATSTASSAASTSTVVRLAPALVVQSLLRFTNQHGHGEVGSSASDEHAEGTAAVVREEGEATRPTLWGGSELSALLRGFYVDFISALPAHARAEFLRAYLRCIDSELSSHLALRQHLHVLAAVEPQPALGAEAHRHLLSLLTSRIHHSSALLKPQLLQPLLAVVCRLSNFARASRSPSTSAAQLSAEDSEGAQLSGRGCGFSLSTFAELLAALPLDSFQPSSAHHRHLLEQLERQKAGQWLAEVRVGWTTWLLSGDGAATGSPHAACSSDAAAAPAGSAGAQLKDERGGAEVDEEAVSGLCSEALRLASLFVLLSSLPSVSASEWLACCAPLEQALHGVYSRGHQPLEVKLRAVALLAYVVGLSLCPSSSLECFPASLRLPHAYLPSGELLRPQRRPLLFGLVAQHCAELLAFADAALQSATEDERAAAWYRALLPPLLFALFSAFSAQLPQLLRYQHCLSERAGVALTVTAEAGMARATTAPLTWLASLSVATVAGAALSSTTSQSDPLPASSADAQLLHSLLTVRLRHRPSSSRTALSTHHTHAHTHPSARAAAAAGSTLSCLRFLSAR